MLQAAPRVLVVDDDLPTCEVMELALVGEGWDIQTCTCGRDALEVLQQRDVDVILLDLVMPEMDAETFLARCRQQGTRETPVLLVSAAPNLEQHAARLGVSGALAKPFDLDDLCALVRQVVAQDLAVNRTGAACHGR
jgi:CheY-like chemotaxis protein